MRSNLITRFRFPNSSPFILMVCWVRVVRGHEDRGAEREAIEIEDSDQEKNDARTLCTINFLLRLLLTMGFPRFFASRFRSRNPLYEILLHEVVGFGSKFFGRKKVNGETGRKRSLCRLGW